MGEMAYKVLVDVLGRPLDKTNTLECADEHVASILLGRLDVAVVAGYLCRRLEQCTLAELASARRVDDGANGASPVRRDNMEDTRERAAWRDLRESIA